ncbi:MAG: hypothetical protein PVF37_22790 [Desulfobacterales bacterium]|jgi:endonuclease/exonuclease/phosphatase family metal-dependent hydrolase
MTYNVYSCVGMDGKLNSERIARVIARCIHDSVALQELDVGQARIDNIFIDPVLEAVDVHIRKTDLVRVASDHLPLVSEIRLPAAMSPASSAERTRA